MAYEVLVLDIDGTLTNSHKVITDRTRKALIALQENGRKVVLASGRSEYGFVHLAKELRMDEFGSYILSFNGAKVMNFQTKDIVYNATLPQDVIPELYHASKELGIAIAGYNQDKLILGCKPDFYLKRDSEACKMPITIVDHFPEYFRNIYLNKCLLSGEPEHMAEVEKILVEQFKNRITIFRSDPFFIECVPLGVDKAYGLSRLLHHMSLTRKQMIACGDGFNDLSMIQFAGLGVAMANAVDVVREHADYVTLSNDEDGIVPVIVKYMQD